MHGIVVQVEALSKVLVDDLARDGLSVGELDGIGVLLQSFKSSVCRTLCMLRQSSELAALCTGQGHETRNVQ